MHIASGIALTMFLCWMVGTIGYGICDFRERRYCRICGKSTRTTFVHEDCLDVRFNSTYSDGGVDCCEPCRREHWVYPEPKKPDA